MEGQERLKRGGKSIIIQHLDHRIQHMAGRDHLDHHLLYHLASALAMLGIKVVEHHHLRSPEIDPIVLLLLSMLINNSSSSSSSNTIIIINNNNNRGEVRLLVPLNNLINVYLPLVDRDKVNNNNNKGHLLDLPLQWIQGF